MTMDTRLLLITSLLLFAGGALLIGASLLHRLWTMMRSERILDRRIEAREQTAEPELPVSRDWKDRLVASTAHWVETPIGRQLVAAEDRQLLDQCGVNDSRGQSLFFLTRTSLGIIFPLIGWALLQQRTLLAFVLTAFFGFGLGYMLPKWIMLHLARERRKKAAEELPLLIDLLRLLQGIGMSIDQSLHIVETEFSSALPVLGKELQIAARQYQNGRTREQSLRRFSTVFDNEDLHALGRLIIQVDRYGGAVQQPLQQFSDRVREQRKLEMKEKVGKLTVKMTSVMVVTLLPALLIITGGAGFLALIRTLGQMGG